jgi:Lysyl-tRNA synthetase (class II)
LSHTEQGDINELKRVRLEKLQELRDMGVDPFGGRFERSTMAQTIKDSFDNFEGQTVQVAGRMMSKRRHGKAGFANLQDYSGSIQLYFRQDDLGPEKYELFKKNGHGGHHRRQRDRVSHPKGRDEHPYL